MQFNLKLVYFFCLKQYNIQSSFLKNQRVIFLKKNKELESIYKKLNLLYKK